MQDRGDKPHAAYNMANRSEICGFKECMQTWSVSKADQTIFFFIIELMVPTCWLLQAAAAAFIIKTITAKAGNLNMMFTEINRCRSTNGNW